MWIGVVVGVPETFATELTQARRAAGDPLAAHVPPHVTLLPPIELAESDLEHIETHLAHAAAQQPSFEMALVGTETFRPVSAVVYVALEHGWDECVALQSRVNSGVLKTKLKFPYHPHVTIAQSVPDQALDRAQEKMSEFTASFMVSTIDLYTWNGQGRWELLKKFPLAPQN